MLEDAHSCDECEAEDATLVGTTMVGFGKRRLGWEVGWRREGAKEIREEEALLRGVSRNTEKKMRLQREYRWQASGK